MVLTFQTRYPPNNNIIILQVIIIRFGFWLIRTKLEQGINLDKKNTLERAKILLKFWITEIDSLGIYNQK